MIGAARIERAGRRMNQSANVLVYSFALSIPCLLAGFGCGPRMNIVTSTTVGLHATPGDGSTQPPQVSLAYKRAEVAVIPTGEGGALDGPAATAAASDDSASSDPCSQSGSDLFSAVTAFGFQTRWFGKTALDSVIATGHAARRLACAKDGAGKGVARGTAAEFVDAMKAVTK